MSSRPGRHIERRDHEVGGHGPTGLPPHDSATEHVDDERDVDHTGPGGAVGEIRNPQLIGTRRGEVALHEIRCSQVRGVGVRGETPLRSANASDAQLAHNASDLFAAHVLAGALGGGPELSLAVDGVVLEPDRHQQHAQFHVTQCAL